MDVLGRFWKWWRAPYRREQRMLVLLDSLLDGQVYDRAVNRYWRQEIMNDITKIEIALDAAVLKLATTQGDVAALKSATTELVTTSKALADAVKALKADAPKTDIQADLDRLQGKAEAVLASIGSVDETVKSVTTDVIAGEDIADDELEAAPATPADTSTEVTVDTTADTTGEAATEPATEVTAPVVDAPAEVAVEAATEAAPEVPAVENAPAPAAVPAEGSGDVIVFDGAVPAAETQVISG